MAGRRVSVDFKWDAAAFRALLQSEEVAAELEVRAQAIAATAGPGHEVETYVGRNRVRVTVRTETREAMLAEAQDRTLTNALDAGR